MKKITAALLIFMMIFPFTVLADDVNAVGAVDASSLNVRRTPEANGQIIGTLSNGEKINIITKTNSAWYKINYYGQTGYISALYVVASRSGEPVIQKDTSVQTTDGMTKGQQVVAVAKQYLGVRYVYGGTSPSGFDCSGLVQYVYKQMGVSINRVAADQTANGTVVSRENLMPGDIVFFHNTSKYTRINHVGIYVGDGYFIHAPQTGDVVKITTLNSGYYATTYVTARRIFN